MDFIYNVDVQLLKIIHFSMKNVFFDFLMPLLRNKYTWLPIYGYALFRVYKLYEIKDSFKVLLIGVCLIGISDLLCAQVFKELFQRIRPCQALSSYQWFSDFGLCGSTYSFPSCHAMNHTVIALFIYRFVLRKWKSALILWVLLICISQIYVGLHYPLDILGGVFFGSIWFFLGASLVKFFVNVAPSSQDT